MIVLQQIRFVVRLDALQHDANRSSPMPVSTEGAGSGVKLILARLHFAAIELHEDEVPHLGDDVARAVDVRGAVLRVARIGAHVVMNLAARPARTGLAHLPEIILAAKAQNSFSRRADLLPEPFRVFVRTDFIVAFVNGEPHARRIELELVDQQVPGKLDRVFLEIIAERKIPEHLEKRLMPRGLADLVQVVMLAAGAHAFLRRAGAHVIALLAPRNTSLN